MPIGPDSYFGDDILRYLQSVPRRAADTWRWAIDSTFGELNRPSEGTMLERAGRVYESVPERAANTWRHALQALQPPPGTLTPNPFSPQSPPVPEAFQGAVFDPAQLPPGVGPNPEGYQIFDGVVKQKRDGEVFGDNAAAPGSTDPFGDSPAMEFQRFQAPNEVDQAVREREIEVLNIRQEIERLDAQRNIAEGFGRITNVTSGDVARGRNGQAPFIDEGSRRRIGELQALQQGDREQQQRKELLRIERAHDMQDQMLAGILQGQKDARTLRTVADKKVSSIVQGVPSDIREALDASKTGLSMINAMLKGEITEEAWGQLRGQMARLVDSGKLSNQDVTIFSGAQKLKTRFLDWLKTRLWDGLPQRDTLNRIQKLFLIKQRDAIRQTAEQVRNGLNSTFNGPLGSDLAPLRDEITRGVLSQAGLPADIFKSKKSNNP